MVSISKAPRSPEICNSSTSCHSNPISRQGSGKGHALNLPTTEDMTNANTAPKRPHPVDTCRSWFARSPNSPMSLFCTLCIALLCV